MKHVPGKASKGFTLVELLVVIAIIGMLAALIMPVLSSARSRGRQSHCANNLHQISMAIMMYRMDHNDRDPDWLSVLFQDDMGYLSKGSEDVLICRSDPSDGADGSKPNGVEEVGDQFSETDDTDENTHETRYTHIERCSYMYEFSAAPCSWKGDGRSWREVKIEQLNEGEDWIFGGRPFCPTTFPIVRCFHHYNEGSFTISDDAPDPPFDLGEFPHLLSLNVAYAGNIFRGPLFWEHAHWAR